MMEHAPVVWGRIHAQKFVQTSCQSCAKLAMRIAWQKGKYWWWLLLLIRRCHVSAVHLKVFDFLLLFFLQEYRV